MGIRDWFAPRQKQAAPRPGPDPAPRFHRDRGRMFDLGRTHALAELFAADRAARDEAWIERFFDAAWCGSVVLSDPPTFLGPDGFPYLRLSVPRPETSFDSQCLANLAEDCLRNGVGAALFASPDDPPEAAQYVLSLGVIDSLLRYDSPFGDPIDLAEAAVPADEGAFSVEQADARQTMIVQRAHDVLVGAPSAEYLPPHLAHSLHAHLTRSWGMTDPGVQLVVDTTMRPHRSLVIGRKRSEFPEGAPIDAMAQALLWHLGPSRMVMLMPEEWSHAQMTKLRSLFEGR
ncbi:MAG: hypothetical protein JO276_05760 [Sphingomonadaceae bacterium]|nr:hypothetical protein [Sphingomonadaceae bacterium]